MALFKNFSLGIKSYGDAHRLIVKHKLWGYVFFPGIINLVLFILVCLLGYYSKDIVVKWVFDFLGLSGEHTGIARFFISLLHVVLNLFVYYLVFMIYLSTYKYIVLMTGMGVLHTPIRCFLSFPCLKVIVLTPKHGAEHYQVVY